MARARNIKPAFFRNEQLVELAYERRLLFVGLWTIADREGRLEDRPKRIKMEIFPADDVDVDAALNDLQAAGFIVRYVVDAGRYIEVCNFSKHQNPHHREPASTIPKPEATPPSQPPNCLGPTGDENVAKPEASLGPDGAEPVPAVLIPDSLIPLSLQHLSHADACSSPGAATGKDVRSIRSKAKNGAAHSAAIALPTCPHREIIAVYHETLPTLPEIRVELWDGSTRARDLQARWRWALTARKSSGEPYAEDARSGVDFFRRYFGHVSRSDFLTGRSGKFAGCDLGWLVKADNFRKVIQGNFDNEGRG